MYPQILQTVSAELTHLIKPILQTLSAELKPIIKSHHKAEDNQSQNVAALINYFSFSHFVELMRIEDSQKRLFYEIQSMQGNWNLRQPNTYYTNERDF